MKLEKILVIPVLLLSFFILSCEESPTQQDDYTGVIEGVDFDQLFAEPTSSEIASVVESFNQRSYTVSQTRELDTLALSVNLGASFLDVRVIAQTIDGEVHYGAIVLPQDTSNVSQLPVVVYNHGGDNGIALIELSLYTNYSDDFVSLVQNNVLVIPSFRSESMTLADGTVLQSEGETSPWDKDVDDALGLLNYALSTTPAADTSKILSFGLSRGACVAMLMSIREPKIDGVVEFFGPTDFMGDYVREVTGRTLNGEDLNLPGLDYLYESFIQPLQDGDLTYEDARLEMLKRSPAYFLDYMAPLQVHHGKADEIVYVSQAEKIIEMAEAAGLSEQQFESYLYDNTGHDQNTVLAGVPAMIIFIERLFTIG